MLPLLKLYLTLKAFHNIKAVNGYRKMLNLMAEQQTIETFPLEKLNLLVKLSQGLRISSALEIKEPAIQHNSLKSIYLLI